MKKLSLFIVATLITLATFSQEFMGIKVDGTKQQITSQFQAKGFTKKNEKSNTIIFKGVLNSSNIEVFATFTPKSGKCWKFTVWMPEQTSWYSLKSDFNKYVEIFTEKYGKADNEYAFFSSPYYEGDGYEMSAVTLDKCVFSSFWGETYSVEISKYKQVKISYENPKNSKLDDEEKKTINATTF